MSLQTKLFEYLDQFGTTRCLGDLQENTGIKRFLTLSSFRNRGRKNDWIALRHDIDHDLDLALELAHHEHARGIRATYFLLHTAPYWDDPLLLSKCRQLHAYGHEVGLHVDLVTEYAQGLQISPKLRLEQLLGHLRSSGVPIRGVAAHGAKACYEHQCTNFWIWKELRTPDPMKAHNRVSAEGIHLDDPQWQIQYPDSHSVRIGDAKLDLWSVSMQDLGVTYEASACQADQYWTDTGGGWKRSPDPAEHDLTHGRHIVLIHPIWWRGTKRVHLISCPDPQKRNQLAASLDSCSNARVLDEWTMTHTRVGREIVRPDQLNSFTPTLLRNAVAHHANLVEGDVIELTSLIPAGLLSEGLNRDTESQHWFVDIPEERVRTAAIDLLTEHPDLYADPSDEPLVPMTPKYWEWMNKNQRAEAHLHAHILSQNECNHSEWISSDLINTPESIAQKLELVWHPQLSTQHARRPIVVRIELPSSSRTLWEGGVPVFQTSGQTVQPNLDLRACEIEHLDPLTIRWARAESSAPQAGIQFQHRISSNEYFLGLLKISSCVKDPVRVLMHCWSKEEDGSESSRASIELGVLHPSDKLQEFRFACNPREGSQIFSLALLAPKEHGRGTVVLNELQIKSVSLRSYLNLGMR